MSDVTRILSQIESGDALAAEQLLQLVYDELRALAAAELRFERPNHTLQATALVHEVYLRLFGSEQNTTWTNRHHFFAHAAKAMRQILVDSARAKNRFKRGGDCQRVEIDDFAVDASDPNMLLDLDKGLTQLAAEDDEAAELVKLRLFAGLSVTEAGELLGMSRTTAYENWKFARSWFARYLR